MTKIEEAIARLQEMAAIRERARGTLMAARVAVANAENAAAVADQNYNDACSRLFDAIGTPRS